MLALALSISEDDAAISWALEQAGDVQVKTKVVEKVTTKMSEFCAQERTATVQPRRSAQIMSSRTSRMELHNREPSTDKSCRRRPDAATVP